MSESSSKVSENRFTGPTVVLLGPPGAGKGTQAARLVAARGLLHLSTGDVLRRAIASGSALGLEVQGLVEDGKLVPDETIARVVGDHLDAADAPHGVLFDGFPRTVAQARLLDGLLESRGLPQPVVVELDVPEEAVLSRLAGRRSCANHGPRPAGERACGECDGDLFVRPDDRAEVVRERLGVYRHDTAPLSDLYRERGALAAIDGTGTLDEVAERCSDAVDRLVQRQTE